MITPTATSSTTSVVSNAQIPNRLIRHRLANRRPTNRRSHDPASHDRAANTESMAKLMDYLAVALGKETSLLIESARQSGVRRGINASIQVIEDMLPRHRKGSSGRAELELVIKLLNKLDIDEVEG